VSLAPAARVATPQERLGSSDHSRVPADTTEIRGAGTAGDGCRGGAGAGARAGRDAGAGASMGAGRAGGAADPAARARADAGPVRPKAGLHTCSREPARTGRQAASGRTVEGPNGSQPPASG
jgi:hypothetical protein